MKKLKKIPVFKNEDEERDLWDTHDTTEYFDWSKAERVSFPNLQITDDPKWMWEAIKEAEIGAKEGNWGMGCVIVPDGKIIGKGHNEGYSRKNRLIHAEILALEMAKDDLEAHRHQATLYTTYDPCPMCVGAMLVYKIKRLVTGIDLDHSGATGLLDHLPPFYRQEKFHIDVTQRILAQECKEVYLKGKPAEKHIKQHKIILK